MLGAQFFDNDGAGCGIVADDFAPDALLVFFDKLFWEAVGIGLERLEEACREER